jgi:hypothetical protein
MGRKNGIMKKYSITALPNIVMEDNADRDLVGSCA